MCTYDFSARATSILISYSVGYKIMPQFHCYPPDFRNHTPFSQSWCCCHISDYGKVQPGVSPEVRPHLPLLKLPHQIADLFALLIVMPFPECHINRITWPFGSGFFSLAKCIRASRVLLHESVILFVFINRIRRRKKL